MAQHHRIKSLEVTGGFLHGTRLEFADGLNCIIGGRGTGKTTVLEALRYALDRMPDPKNDKSRYQKIESLLKSNLAEGTLRVEVETQHGLTYTVSRGMGEEPFIVNEKGEPSEFRIGKDTVFGADIYSQSEIEDIASEPLFQLRLIDKFVAREIEKIEKDIQDTLANLERNGRKTLETRKIIDNLTEATYELPDIEERIRGFASNANSPDSAIQKEHEHASLRSREAKTLDHIETLYTQVNARISGVKVEFTQESEAIFAISNASTPNEDVIRQTVADAQQAVTAAVRELNSVARSIDAARENLTFHREKLKQQHKIQEAKYRELLTNHENERVIGVERQRLEQRRSALLREANKRQGKTTEFSELNAERRILRARLSELRDKRYELRLGVASRLNQHLSPMIKVRIEQYGNMTKYRELLMQAVKGSGIHYSTIVDKVVGRVSPTELAAMIQDEDRPRLERELELDSNRATKFIIQLKDTPEIFAIEAVELYDHPVLELKDGPEYKDSASLSTGQKCTVILPILLMESERPLLIDQPEDNLDNAFIYETIVSSLEKIRNHRQLILVTHNPNIPVLGDAARVFCLHSTGRLATVVNSGSVDDVASQIMTILEGGREAFTARKDRYDRPIPQ